jgi:hypothetical protein
MVDGWVRLLTFVKKLPGCKEVAGPDNLIKQKSCCANISENWRNETQYFCSKY